MCINYYCKQENNEVLKEKVALGNIRVKCNIKRSL